MNQPQLESNVLHGAESALFAIAKAEGLPPRLARQAQRLRGQLCELMDGQDLVAMTTAGLCSLYEHAACQEREEFCECLMESIRAELARRDPEAYARWARPGRCEEIDCPSLFFPSPSAPGCHPGLEKGKDNSFGALTNAYCQVEGAAEVLRDLLSEGNANRLALAMHDACIADKEEMERTLRFLDWLLEDGEDHLDGMLADIYGIDPEAIENERRLRGDALRHRARLAVVNQQVAISQAVVRAHRGETATGQAPDPTADTRARLQEIKAQAAQLQGSVALSGARGL